MTPLHLRKENCVAKSHQIQAFRVLFVHHTHSADCSRIGNYAHTNGAGDFPTLYFWRCVLNFRLVALYYGCGDVDADDRF